MIAFREFSKRFGSVSAVSSLTMEAHPGEIIAVLGPNGSGKTTSIKAAAGLVRPSSGVVELGQPPRPATDAKARAVSAFLPQHVTFPGALTGAEVLEFHRRLRGCTPLRVREVAAFTGLESALARPVAKYSGGMTQRLGLAVALMPATPVLLLDEPTGALDPDGLCAFYAVLQADRRDERTVLFSSHQMGDVERLADRFVVLVGGRLVASFTAQEVMARLADRGVLKIAMGRFRPTLVDEVRRIAPAAVLAANQLIVPAPTARRLEVLDVVRASGAEITAVSAQDGRLDTFYSELVGSAA